MTDSISFQVRFQAVFSAARLAFFVAVAGLSFGATNTCQAQRFFDFVSDIRGEPGEDEVLARLELAQLPANHEDVVSLTFTEAGQALFLLGPVYQGEFDRTANQVGITVAGPAINVTDGLLVSIMGTDVVFDDRDQVELFDLSGDSLGFGQGLFLRFENSFGQLGNATINEVPGQFVAIPEPSSVVILAVFIVFAILFSRRRDRAVIFTTNNLQSDFASVVPFTFAIIALLGIQNSTNGQQVTLTTTGSAVRFGPEALGHDFNHRLGESVAIGDGRIAIGAPGFDYSEDLEFPVIDEAPKLSFDDEAGGVFVFNELIDAGVGCRRDTNGQINGSSASPPCLNDYAGHSVAINEDGLLAIGAPGVDVEGSLVSFDNLCRCRCDRNRKSKPADRRLDCARTRLLHRHNLRNVS